MQNKSITFLWIWQFPDNLEGLLTTYILRRNLKWFADSVEKFRKILGICYLKSFWTDYFFLNKFLSKSERNYNCSIDFPWRNAGYFHKIRSFQDKPECFQEVKKISDIQDSMDILESEPRKLDFKTNSTFFVWENLKY